MSMWIAATFGSTAAFLLAAAIFMAPEKVYACSAGADFDPVAASDVIVEGRFWSFQVLPDAPVPGFEPKGVVEYDFQDDPFVPIQINFSVDVVRKGHVAGDVIGIVERTAYGPDPLHEGDYWWVGASGCIAFDSDPTGQYAILGLRRNADGTYGTDKLLVFSRGVEPGSEGYEAAAGTASELPRASGLPGLGSGPTDGGVSLSFLAAGVAAVGVVLLIASLAVRGRVNSR